MSQAREDWKFFEQISDTMCIKDLTGHQSIEVRNISRGRWAAFCVYDDVNRIERVLMATEDIMEIVDSSKRRKPLGKFSFYEDVAPANAGIFCFFDKAHMNKYQKGFESKFDAKTLEKWGSPEDESKSEGRRFIELACHLTKFHDLDLLDSARYGVFFRAHSNLSLGFTRDDKTGEIKMIEAVVKH